MNVVTGKGFRARKTRAGRPPACQDCAAAGAKLSEWQGGQGLRREPFMGVGRFASVAHSRSVAHPLREWATLLGLPLAERVGYTSAFSPWSS
jgi:hypothetical protein